MRLGEPCSLESYPQFSLVIPAYNEVERISSTLRDLMFTLDQEFSDTKYELLIIMDGCKDGTPDKVKAITKNRQGVSAIVLPDRLGKGGAIMEALKYVKGGLVAFIDADGSIPPDELSRLVTLADDQYDLVIGSRYDKSSVLPIRRTFRRFLFSRSFNVFLKILFWRLRGFRDTQCGVKVFSKRLLDTVNGDLLISDFAFDVNLIYSALFHGFKVKEVGIKWIEKEGSKLSNKLPKQAVYMGFSLLRLRIYYSPLRNILHSSHFGKIDVALQVWLHS